ncbi:MAG: hypothetical protein FJY86_00400 [Candidatus Diapherotrites archaeon]|uniref:Uncharacterized protein n=1 Tax=Candidatus Iainarchaeum sp. TaxID=3101447 RepID=A0A8T4C5M0_9ARCH|nr:hypothetical protein [Candidatus Diapherotrites archaeon]
MSTFLRDPQRLMPWFIALAVVVHISLQILSFGLDVSENSIVASLIYLVAGFLFFLVAAYWLEQGVQNASRQYLLMGLGMTALFVTLALVGLGLLGTFGPVKGKLLNTGLFLLLIGAGTAGVFWIASPSTRKLTSGKQKIVLALVFFILFVSGLSALQNVLPNLYAGYGLPSLLRQQLVTIVLILFTLGAVRFALSEWGKETFSGQWFLIGIMMISLTFLNLLLSTMPGDIYSWAGRLLLILSAGAFIQSVWWHDRAVV